MKYFSDKDYIYYQGTDIPINKLGIKSPQEIEELENQLFLKTYEHFHKSLNEKTIFDQKYLKNLHRFAFSKVYSWAEKYRNKNISKGNAVFCQAVHVENEATKIFKEFKKDNYLKNFHNIAKEKFAEKIAYYYVRADRLASIF